MKPAIYARVSTMDQDVGPQLIELREFCTRRGWPTPVDYIDTISGSKLKRPALDGLMAAAFRREVDVILVVKVDRFARSVLHFSSLLETLNAAGVRFIATSQGIDTDQSSPSGRLLMQILSAVAEFEREIIRERTQAGLRNARANGRIGGRPRREFEPAKVARMRQEGLSWRVISERMGIPASTLRDLRGGRR